MGGLAGWEVGVDDENRAEPHLQYTHCPFKNELYVAEPRNRRATEAGALCISCVDGDDLRMSIEIYLAQISRDLINYYIKLRCGCSNARFVSNGRTLALWYQNQFPSEWRHKWQQ